MIDAKVGKFFFVQSHFLFKGELRRIIYWRIILSLTILLELSDCFDVWVLSVLSLSYLGFKFYLYWIFLSQSVFYIFVWKNVKCEKFDRAEQLDRAEARSSQRADTCILYKAGPGLMFYTGETHQIVIIRSSPGSITTIKPVRRPIKGFYFLSENSFSIRMINFSEDLYQS